MGAATLRNFIDVHISANQPDKNYSTQHLLRTNGTTEYAYLHVQRPFPLGAWVVSAKLRLHAGEAGTSRTMSLTRIAVPVTLTRITYNQMPAVTGAAASVTQVAVKDGLFEFDVTSHMRDVSAGAGWYGWRLSSSAASLLRFWSSNSIGGFHPVLEVAWSDAPRQPSGLSPAGNLAVSLSLPTLSYVFTDVSGDTTLAAHRVQMHTEPITSGTPLFDSGEVATDAPVMDLAATAAPAVPLNATRWWRAQAKDGAGLWSSWSPWVQWQRRAKPTVTITYPVHNSIVETPTPTVTWTVTGSNAVQTAYRVDVLDNLRRVVYTSGKVAAAATRAHAIPAGVLKRDDAKYYIRLLVWDGFARVGIPGDPTYREAANHVTFDRDGSLTPITGFTAAPTPDHTGVQLEWARASAPANGWVIVRDGEVVHVIDDPADASTGGTGYAWVDYTGHPRRAHTYEVAPIIGNTAGKGGPEATAATEPVGVWLLDPDSGVRVSLTNTGDDLRWDMGETSTVHNPLGERAPVLITQALRGYEGHVSGTLFTQPLWDPKRGGLSAQQARDAFLALKERPGKTLRLIAQDQNLPVVAWNLRVSPNPVGPNVAFAASFDFAQVSEFDYTPDL